MRRSALHEFISGALAGFVAITLIWVAVDRATAQSGALYIDQQ